MGNSISDQTMTVLCKCSYEMISSTPSNIYHQRIKCSECNTSIAHSDVMFHCPIDKNKNHKWRYDLCESCSKTKSIKVYCKLCNVNSMQKKKCINGKCNQCGKYLNKLTNKYHYLCKTPDCNYIQCTSCSKTQYSKHVNIKQQNNNYNNGLQQKMTTLHGYKMNGPYIPDKNHVWYCDYKLCQYTKHGLYRRYKIANWRSSVFGKKFVLCDGCVRQYEKLQPVIMTQPQQINVEIKLNDPNQYIHRSQTDFIQNQPEGIMENNNNIKRTFTYM